MATPNTPPPERKPAIGGGAGQAPQSAAAAQDTKRPSDSVPMVSGVFTKLPMRFGRYQVEKLLGKGNMGAVYLALDTQLGRKVAIKIPKLSAKGSEKLLKRLKTEAMAAAQIDHPSVCPVYDTGDIEGIPFIAMQYIEGETLKESLQKQPRTPAEAAAIVLHLAEGLAEAHARKIYHRDLKPDNIKINRRGVPVIMDFGLAKLATTLRADASATQAGTTLGTPAYMSPEQANGQVAEVDQRSDIYALGVIFYEMLTGQWPFSGSAVQVMAQKTMGVAPSTLTIKPDLDPQLAAVCHKMIAQKREDRYQTAEEIIAGLKAAGLEGVAPQSTSSTGEAQTSAHLEFPAFECAEEGLASRIARKRQQDAASTSPAHRLHALLGTTVESMKSLIGSKTGQKPPAKKSPATRFVWVGAVAGILLAGFVVLWAGGIFKVQTKEGILVLQVNEPGAEVFVDGEQIDVTWDKGGKSARLSVAPGERKIKVTKDGFSVVGKKLTFKVGASEIFKATLQPKDEAREKEPASPGTVAAGTRAGEVREFAAEKISFCWCPPGSFKMGSLPSEAGITNNEGGADGKPVNVTLTRGFWLGQTEVTQGQWESVQGTQPWNGKFSVRTGTNFPAVYVSHSEADSAEEFCEKLTERERAAGRLATGWSYRLPTEAEWEYACRAATNTAYSFGDDAQKLDQYAWFDKNTGKSGEAYAHPVSTKRANPWGFYDMHGNVLEWCADIYDEVLPGGIDPRVTKGSSNRVRRGGGWSHPETLCRSADRIWLSPSSRGPTLGFRIALSSTAESLPKNTVGKAAPPSAAELANATTQTSAAKAPAEAEEKKPNQAATTDGFTPLFNGKDLAGWKTHPSQPGNWRVENGVLIGSGPERSHLYTKRGDFTDFHLRVETRINDGGNSGVYFRSAFGPVRPVNNSIWPNGYEAQINSTHWNEDKTGSLRAEADHTAVVLVKGSPVPPGQWFALDIVANGNRIVVKVNDKTTAEYVDKSHLFTSGHIVLQSFGFDGKMDRETVVEFRKIEIKEFTDPIIGRLHNARAVYEAAREQYREGANKYFDKREEAARKQGKKNLVDQIKAERSAFEQRGDLPQSAPADLKRKIASARSAMESAYVAAVRDYTKAKNDSESSAVEKELEQFKRDQDAPWVALFNGKDTRGWHASAATKANWQVVGGTLMGSGEGGFLFTDRSDYQNFRLRVEAMLTEGADSGVFFRAQDERLEFAYEAEIGSGPGNTGSFYVLDRGVKRPAPAPQPVPVGKWSTMEVLAEDNRFTIWVDGTQTAQYEDKERRFSKGPIAIQQFGGPKAGVVSFRKIEIKELPSK